MYTHIAISSKDEKNITGHAGKCEHFFVFKVDEKANIIKENLRLEKGNLLHDALHGANDDHPLFEMDIILTQSVGQSAITKLEAKDVKAHIILETDPDIAIHKLIKGTLEAVAPASHHHDHEHAHEHGHAGCTCGKHKH